MEQKIMRKVLLLVLLGICIDMHSQVLNKREILDKFDFWTNRDWVWYENNIPFLETPDKDIDLTYYYRWELLTMHLVYGDPVTGYASTEFIDRPWWSGSFGTISCPVGHQLYDFRWLRDQRYLEDYVKYWLNEPGAQPQNYTNWLGDAVWQGYKVKRDEAFAHEVLDGLIRDYQKWEELYWVAKEGMFAWDGMHDGMETNINSRQTANWFSGAPGYRPTLNSYMWAHAKAIVNFAKLSNRQDVVCQYQAKADEIKNNFQMKCWDPKRSFFFHRFQNDELTEDKTDTIRANTLTYQSGPYAGNPHGRELIGYIPWYFNMVDDNEDYSKAWQFLMDTNYFDAEHGFTVTERHDPLFEIACNCCAWSGNSWPFATSQTIKAMSNYLNNYKHKVITEKDFFRVFRTFALAQRKDGKPYIAEALHPDTGSWDGHDVKGHSEHYYHSSYIDLVIADLIGIKPQDDDSIIVSPLTPEDWDYFALDNVCYHGHDLSILWDKTGEKYNQGKGFRIMADGKTIAVTDRVQELRAYLPFRQTNIETPEFVNYAVNNSRETYPLAIASFPGIFNPISKMNDGQFWYLTTTPNQWSNIYSDNKVDWAGVDFGIKREIEKIILYFVEDDNKIKAPKSYKLEYWDGSGWKKIPNQKRQYNAPLARKGNAIEFGKLTTSKVRVVLTPQDNYNVGISELETWGIGQFPLQQAENITLKPDNLLKVTASYTSEFDDINAASDGLIDPNGRWTAFNSPNKQDWIELEFRNEILADRAYIYFYEDGNILPPQKVTIQFWNGKSWDDANIRKTIPEQPFGNALYIMYFDQLKSSKFRLSLLHKSGKPCGIYEVKFLKK